MNDVVEKKPTFVSVIDASNYAAYQGAGMEQAEAKDMALPYLVILQKLSPQVDEDNGAYVAGAKAGMILETATGQLFDGKVGVSCAPCYFRKAIVEWKPRESGGGLVREHMYDERLFENCKPDTKGKMVNPQGNLMVDTKYHYVNLLLPTGPFPVVIAMTSTQMKRSRKWLSLMTMRKMPKADGSSFTPPSFAYRYHLTTVLEEKNGNTWYSWDIAPGDLITDGEIARANIKFSQSVGKGDVKLSDPVAGMKGDIADDEIPF